MIDLTTYTRGTVVVTEPATSVVSDYEICCPQCSKFVCRLASRPWKFTCPRCKTDFESIPILQTATKSA